MSASVSLLFAFALLFGLRQRGRVCVGCAALVSLFGITLLSGVVVSRRVVSLWALGVALQNPPIQVKSNKKSLGKTLPPRGQPIRKRIRRGKATAINNKQRNRRDNQGRHQTAKPTPLTDRAAPIPGGQFFLFSRFGSSPPLVEPLSYVARRCLIGYTISSDSCLIISQPPSLFLILHLRILSVFPAYA